MSVSWKMLGINKIKGSHDSLRTLDLDLSRYVNTDSCCSEAENNWSKQLCCLDLQTILLNEQEIPNRTKV